MSDRERVLELLRKAVAILEGDNHQEPPTPIRAIEPGEDEVVLEGTLGRFEALNVGADQIPLFKGTMRVQTPEGPERWVKFNCWRKVALWSSHNLSQGQSIQAIGGWETSTYTNRDGELIEQLVFSARLVTAA